MKRIIRLIGEIIAHGIIQALTFGDRVKCALTGHKWNTRAPGFRRCERCFEIEWHEKAGK